MRARLAPPIRARLKEFDDWMFPSGGWLRAAEPIEGRLLRRLAGPVRDDYWLFAPDAPLPGPDGAPVATLLVAARWEGEALDLGPLETSVYAAAPVSPPPDGRLGAEALGRPCLGRIETDAPAGAAAPARLDRSGGVIVPFAPSPAP
ncbi:hypothetical protein P2H44_24725 [Albimonas sp. CAU 1670]|uniref:hypothetical protein n=1 Tax=Albimonas sp. CAU 1670 TaxID=3032599 RepID=UPI0023DC2FA2|nr:hypothetical protein [Albimonas sp. CAU 1670]MDF2235770.1 hypothetical protein [Albimonas sp. CAU 1670]